jgi:UMF1 family MFS transporter
MIAAERARQQRGWYFYDWANSAFATTVLAVLLGPYLTALARSAAGPDGNVSVLGTQVAYGSVWPYSVSLAVFLQVLVLPLAGAWADYGRRKREMLGILAYVGAGATVALYWVDGTRFVLGSALFVVANLAFGASVVVYNSFLPEIAAADERDAVSAKGWGLGYLGGGLLLAANLALFSHAAALGLTEQHAVRISLASAGVWWAVFTVIPLRALRGGPARRSPNTGESAIGAALRQLRQTASEIRAYRNTMLFLLAYLLYNDAIQTVIAVATQFGADVLSLSMSDLTAAVLLVQFVAFLGAMVFARIARRIGNKRAVMLSLVIWSATLVYIYAAVHGRSGFYVAAAVIGTVLGGSQALSRSIFSLMIPTGREAEYFSIYELSDKGTSWLGPLLFGLANQWTGDRRVAIVSLIVFFAAGLVLLARVDVQRGMEEASRAGHGR